MKRISSFLLLLFAAVSIHSIVLAQGDVHDLLSKLKSVKEDTSKVLLLYDLGYAYEYSNEDSAIICYELANNLSKQLDYTTGQAKYFGNITAVYNEQGKYRKSLAINLEGLEFVVRHKDKKREANQYANIGNNYLYLEKWDSAIFYYSRALPAFEAENDSMKMAAAYTNLSEAYRKNSQYEKALNATKQAALLSKTKDEQTYLNAIYNEANVLVDMRKFEDAIKYYTESELLSKKLSNDFVLVNVYGAYVEVYEKLNDYGKMKDYAAKFYALSLKLNNGELLSRSQYGMANAFFYNKNYDSCRKYVLESIAASEKDSIPNNLKKGFRLYALLELVQKGNVSAFQQYDHKADSMDNIAFNETLLRNTQDLEEKYETQKKEKQILLQQAAIQQHRLWMVLMGCALIAVLLISFLAIRSYQHKQKLLLREKELQRQQIIQFEKEKQLTATQAVLQGQDEERTRLAKDLHDGLGGMLSGIKFSFRNMKENLIMTPDNQQSFERSMEMLDSSIKELRRVAHNMMPESLIKFGLDASLNDMCDYLNQSGSIKATYQSLGLKDVPVDKNIAVNIYRVIQELLNNTVKHAAATGILVQVILEGNWFSITVEDNGKGFDTAVTDQTKGIGWSNIRNRIDYFNGKIDVQSSADKGTSVFIEFNNLTA